MRKCKWDSVLTKQFLTKVFVEQDRSVRNVAEEVGCSTHTILRHKKEYGINDILINSHKCKECGSMVISSNLQKKYCSKSCKSKFEKREFIKKYGQKKTTIFI